MIMFDFKRKAKKERLSQMRRTLETLWPQQCDVTEIYGNVTNLHLTANHPLAFSKD